MSVSSRAEIRQAVLDITRQSKAQIGNLVDDFINQAINEISDPGWAYTRRDFTHNWSFLRRKTTFLTATSTTDYVLERDIDRVAILTQTVTPIKLIQIPDDRFFQFVPNPTDTGNPRIYRLWEHEGVATRLATADKLDVVSSSTSDAGDSTLSVAISGYVSGIWTTETYALNGTTVVTGSNTFDAREIYDSKQKDTTGTITVTENSGGTTLTTMGPDERNPRFKVISLYPQPSSAITMSLEYYTRIPLLEADSSVPAFDRKWHYIVKLGALAKVFQYLNKETNFITQQGLFASAVRSMVSADASEPDLIIHMAPRRRRVHTVHLRRSEDAVA